MKLDKRFALLASNGDVLYPHQKKQQATGRYGFALTTPEHGSDRNGGGYYTTDLIEAVKGVIFKGWGIRARAERTAQSRRGASYKLGKNSIDGYWLAPELRHIAQSAPKLPVERLPSKMAADTSVPVKHDGSATALARIEKLSTNDYVAALQGLGHDGIASSQLSLLIWHAAAPGQTLSLKSIASRGRYEDTAEVEREYGKLGRFFVEYLSIQDLVNPALVLFLEGPLDATGQRQWIVRPALVEALKELDLLEGEVRAPGLLEAAEEVKADPQCRNIPETTRRALINARIGQGGYRKRMLQVWDSKCALTGCGIETVLVASHAKQWAKATNEERLDEYNGLLLVATVDRLYDAGLISFADDGVILLSDSLNDEELATLGLSIESQLRKVADRHKPYFQAHRLQHRFET